MQRESSRAQDRQYYAGDTTEFLKGYGNGMEPVDLQQRVENYYIICEPSPLYYLPIRE